MPVDHPVPKSWPPNLRYLPRPIPSPLLPRTFPLPPPLPPSPLTRIRPITTPSHPAHGQHGLFTTRPIKPHTRILPYHGIYHLSSESDPASDYDLWVTREWVDPGTGETYAVGVDASNAGNEGRFVNDYRGVLLRENARFEIEEGEGGWKRVWVVATREIQRGEEVCVSYGKGFWEGRRAEEGEAEEGEKQWERDRERKEAEKRLRKGLGEKKKGSEKYGRKEGEKKNVVKGKSGR